MTVGLYDTVLDYVDIAVARNMSGLRMALGAFTARGPWRESCKGVFYVKGLEYTPVKSCNAGIPDAAVGMDGSQSELIEWSGQTSVPVVAYNDELPLSKWYDQLYLAERLQPDPPLIPDDIEDRIRMFGLAHEVLGENGLVWNKRHQMGKDAMDMAPDDEQQRAFWEFFRKKYKYSAEADQASGKRIAEILGVLDEQLQSQQAKGRRYFIGGRLSALDIYWACACGLINPMEKERCPMADLFRGPYGNSNPDVAAALTDRLIAHRDFIYEEHLELPVVF